MKNFLTVKIPRWFCLTAVLRAPRGGFNTRQIIIFAIVAIITLLVLGYVGFCRPKMLVDSLGTNIVISNQGKSDAVVFRVEGFVYQADHLSYITNMPEIHQKVKQGTGPVQLQIPTIPAPDLTSLQSPCYLKLIIRYHIASVPIFRYKVMLFLKNEMGHGIWKPVKTIPARFRSLGKAGIGDIDMIRLHYQ